MSRERPGAAASSAAGRPAGAVVPFRSRLDSIDLVRGFVMAVMALDHARDYFSNVQTGFGDHPTEVWMAMTPSWKALFLTRWVTHFCAPVFVFLAGTSAFLSGSRKSKGELARFLFTRGLWLVVLELTIVDFVWMFDLNFHLVFLQVIWVIGVSMIVLSALVFLPTAVVAALGVVMIAGHNLLDGARGAALGLPPRLWSLLHVPDTFDLAPGYTVFVAYPLVPWIGVMAAGYGFGALYRMSTEKRRAALLGLGSALTLAFLGLRSLNVYGDAMRWTGQKDLSSTLLGFVNTTKYPPSLLFLLMTLGPAILALGLLDGRSTTHAPRGWLHRAIVTFGRVPLFYYVIHVFLLHVGAGVYAVAKFGPVKALALDPLNLPPEYGESLPFVYLVWIGALVLLYVPCRWFAALKQRRNDVWLSYL